jgi:hypothetical protein
MQPRNWESCWPPHEWLLPAAGDLIRMREPYKTERQFIESLNQLHD